MPFEILSDSVFQHVSDTKTPQGVMCVVKQKHYNIEDLLKIENPHFMVLDNLQDPGNLGTIVRTAEGAGVDAVFLSKESVDIFNPKTIRSTMGSIYRMPVVYVDDLLELLDIFKKKGNSGTRLSESVTRRGEEREKSQAYRSKGRAKAADTRWCACIRLAYGSHP